MAFVTTSALPRTPLCYNAQSICVRRSSAATPVTPVVPLDIQAAKHAQFKATKKHYRKRPKKHRPSDRNRAPPSFDPEPLRAEGLPPVMTIIPAAEAGEDDDENVAEQPAEEIEKAVAEPVA